MFPHQSLPTGKSHSISIRQWRNDTTTAAATAGSVPAAFGSHGRLPAIEKSCTRAAMCRPCSRYRNDGRCSRPPSARAAQCLVHRARNAETKSQPTQRNCSDHSFLRSSKITCSGTGPPYACVAAAQVCRTCTAAGMTEYMEASAAV